MDEAELQRLADELAIRKVLTKYCRGIDRCDGELLKSVYWPDAVDNHGVFNGTAMDFVEHIIPALKRLQHTMHQISNVLIDLDGDRAKVETYVCAYHIGETEKGLRDLIFLGRYLDRFERRNGEWRIAERLVVMDWNRNHPATAIWEEEMYRELRVRGERQPEDPSYGLFGKSWLA